MQWHACRKFPTAEDKPQLLRSLGFPAKDDVAYIVGAYGYGDAPGDIGKFTLTLHRDSGKPWLIFSDMDNLNASCQPPVKLIQP
ncbi:hypothetical protein XarjCFBP8253_21400 [Xanthomonas arboricola pv. juglandis]|nr:hypothetical protein C1H21_09950 [Xanthomonas arboricola pv. juglandis]PPT94640.1 hypothetical protein XarjCFBP8253_21400 [Xanthomonas arboricola pv. juglandis]PPU04787.1 hypothetical protein XacyCFBP2565_22485 [Xanthomonas arboricola pv. corylina]PPU54432.1 hypothetical protein XacyCFBP1159_22150 [Xanthomonas arboricola pv. corylina]